jgi:hypothetical protein
MAHDQPPLGTPTGTPKKQVTAMLFEAVNALRAIIYAIQTPKTATALNCTLPRSRVEAAK